MTATRWLISRLVPAILLVAAGGILAGLFRSTMTFLPGIAGMAAGGVLGWLTGRLAREDPGEIMGFGLRAGLALGAGVLFETLGAVTVSILHTRPGEAPLRWLSGVLDGHRGEPFFGISHYSLQSVSGRLDGGWWLGFVVLDLLLFAALFLVSHGAGSSPDEEVLEDDEGPDAPETLEPEPEPPLPAAPATSRIPGGALVFGIFVGLSMAALIVTQQVWSARSAPAYGPQAHEAAAELAGPWVFGQEASFLGSGSTGRRFTLSRGPRGDLAGRGGSGFLLTLAPRRDGTWTGRLVVPGRAAFAVVVVPSDDGEALRFVLRRDLGAGPPMLEVTAHRLPMTGE